MEKYYLMLEDIKYAEQLKPALEQYGLKVVHSSHLIPIIAVEFDPRRVKVSELEKMLLGLTVDGKKAVRSIEQIPVITFPEKKAEGNLKVIDEDAPRIEYPNK